MGTSVQKHKIHNKESKPHMCTDEKNGPMNADEKGRQYVGC